MSLGDTQVGRLIAREGAPGLAAVGSNKRLAAHDATRAQVACGFNAHKVFSGGSFDRMPGVSAGSSENKAGRSNPLTSFYPAINTGGSERKLARRMPASKSQSVPPLTGGGGLPCKTGFVMRGQVFAADCSQETEEPL